MAEEEAKAIARETLQSLEMRRGWHHIIVRCGPNTTKDFMERSEPGVVLGDDDIFFVDIGPIYGDTEGDAGETFVFGIGRGPSPGQEGGTADLGRGPGGVVHQGQHRARSSTTTPPRWQAGYGWKLNMDLSGHRLSDFPHSAHYDGPLAEVEFRPSPNLWVLEIAIAHPDRNFGAFYEDLLLEDQSFPE